MSNGLEGHKSRSSIHSRSSRGSGGMRPQSMFEPRDQEKMSQKQNKVCNSSLKASFSSDMPFLPLQ